MSYPSVRYDGAGTVNAQLRRADTPQELQTGERGGMAYLATQASTGGDYGLFRRDMGAEPGGPRPHFHRTMSESFFVLSGTVDLYDGGRWVTAQPGDLLYVPPGGIHAFRNADGPASMLILFAPGAPREEYFEEMASMTTEQRDRMSEQDWDAFYARHDQYMIREA